MPQLIGLVLAGGGGHRLGRSKGNLEIDGMTLAERAARVLHPLCGSVLISVAPGAANPAPTHTSVEDEEPAGRGPLAGIATAFATTGQADLLVLACDYPKVGQRLLQTVVAASGAGNDLAIVTDRRGRDHPLVGVWRRSAERHVRDALEDRIYKVRALLSRVELRRVGPVDLVGFDLDDVLVNVNTAADLKSLETS